jgi:8-oxo-dGTP diphosphatase
VTDAHEVGLVDVTGRADDALVRSVTDLVGAAVRDGAALGWAAPPPPDEVAALLRDLQPGHATTTAVLDDGRLVGWGYWQRCSRTTHPHHGDVGRLVVDVAHRGHGLGRRLLDSLVAGAQAADVELLTLDVRHDQTAALALYRSAGFVDWGRLPGVVALGETRFDAVHLVRHLGQVASPGPAESSFHLVAWLVLRDAQGRVLLGRRAGVAYAAGLWGLPGGHVEDDESFAAAAAREAAEEVGVRVDPAALRTLGVTRYVDADARGVDAYLLATTWDGDPRPVSECDAVGWFAPDDLPAGALPWLAQALDVHLGGDAISLLDLPRPSG